MRYAAKKDTTHKPIIELLRKSGRFSHVIDTSNFGFGFPDIMLIINVKDKSSIIYFVECKTGKAKLMKNQRDFESKVSPFNFFKLSSIEDTIKFIETIF